MNLDLKHTSFIAYLLEDHDGIHAIGDGSNNVSWSGSIGGLLLHAGTHVSIGQVPRWNFSIYEEIIWETNSDLRMLEGRLSTLVVAL